MIWFTSDTHFNHENIIQYCNRPFSDLGEMTETLIENWNRVVNIGDIVYHLGDFALSYGAKHAGIIDSILSRLKGNLFLIHGNHDRKEVVRHRRWVKVTPYHEIKPNGQRIVLCHYPLRSWNQMSRGAWMLHGHCHGNLPIEGKIMDVGVDPQNFYPVNFEDIQWT